MARESPLGIFLFVSEWIVTALLPTLLKKSHYYYYYYYYTAEIRASSLKLKIKLLKIKLLIVGLYNMYIFKQHI
jgi:hypothetical protein